MCVEWITMNTFVKSVFCFFFLCLTSVITVQANVLQSKQEQSAQQSTEKLIIQHPEQSGLHWEFDLGLIAFYHQGLVESLYKDDEQINLSVFASGGAYFDNFFVELAPLSGRPLTFGYTLYKKETRQLNLIAESVFQEISEQEQEQGNLLDGIDKRESSTEVGIEYFGILKKYDFRVKLLHDGLSKHHGTIGSLEVSRPFFTRHVMFVPGFSLVYIDDNAASYYYGVSKDEQTTLRPFFKASDAFVAKARLYLERPMDDDWSIVASASYSFYSDGISDSPLVNGRDNTYNMSVGVIWTF